MSVKIMGMVWDLQIDPNKKFVLMAYADHADHKGGNIWPAIDTIVKKTCYHERSVQRITRELEEDGYLVSDGKGPVGTNKWRIPLSEGGDKIAPRQIAGGGTDSGDMDSGGILTPKLKEPSFKEEEEGKIDFSQVYTFFQNNIGPGKTYDHELLGDMCDEHTPHWVLEALKISVKRNARNLSYTDAILKRWAVDGYGSERKNGKGKSNGKSNNQPDLDDGFMEELEAKRRRLEQQA